MVQLSGRYQVTESVNYVELLMKAGFTEDKAKAVNDAKLICSVTVDDIKVVIQYESPIKQETILEFGKESNEKLPIGKEVKSTATRQGNIITVVSSEGDKSYTRTFTFNETGVEMKISGASMEAKRIFKRL